MIAKYNLCIQLYSRRDLRTVLRSGSVLSRGCKAAAMTFEQADQSIEST